MVVLRAELESVDSVDGGAEVVVIALDVAVASDSGRVVGTGVTRIVATSLDSTPDFCVEASGYSRYTLFEGSTWISARSLGLPPLDSTFCVVEADLGWLKRFDPMPIDALSICTTLGREGRPGVRMLALSRLTANAPPALNTAKADIKAIPRVLIANT